MAVALLALALVWIFFQGIRPVAGDWESGQRLVIGLAPILLVVLGGFLLGAVAATRIPAPRLLVMLGGRGSGGAIRAAAWAGR